MDIENILKTVGAVKQGHFIGTSGRHLPAYINKDLIISRPKFASRVGKLFTTKVKDKSIDVVVAPAVAGIVLGQWTAYHLSSKKEVPSVFTEKDQNNNQIFKRGYDKVLKNKKVLIVEDITTKGSSVKKLIKAVRSSKGKIVAVVVMVNRDPKLVNSKSLGVPFFALTTLEIPSYDPEKCPLCNKGIPINKDLGHGNKSLK